MIARAENLSRHFASVEGGGDVVRAVENASFELEAGRIIALFGRSGSGKTTLLNLLAGLDRPTSGQLWLGEVEMTRASEAAWAAVRRDAIGFVYQRFHLVARRRAEDSVALPLLYKGAAVGEAYQAARLALEAVGLGGLVRQRSAKLSGGQNQRVVLARALAGAPQLLLADEPTGNLDAETAAGILALLRDWRDEHGTTIVITTHDELVREIADETWEMRDGRLVTGQGAGAAAI